MSLYIFQQIMLVWLTMRTTKLLKGMYELSMQLSRPTPPRFPNSLSIFFFLTAAVTTRHHVGVLSARASRARRCRYWLIIVIIINVNIIIFICIITVLLKWMKCTSVPISFNFYYRYFFRLIFLQTSNN